MSTETRRRQAATTWTHMQLTLLNWPTILTCVMPYTWDIRPEAAMWPATWLAMVSLKGAWRRRF